MSTDIFPDYVYSCKQGVYEVVVLQVGGVVCMWGNERQKRYEAPFHPTK